MPNDTFDAENNVIRRRKNSPVALIAMVVMIIFSVFFIFSISGTFKDHLNVDVEIGAPKSEFSWTIKDNAEVIGNKAKESILSYNEMWDRRYSSVITVVTEPTACTEEDLEELSWYNADVMGLGEGDAILMMSTGNGGKNWYFNYGDDFATIMTMDVVENLTNILSSWDGKSSPDDMLCDFYIEMNAIYSSNFGMGNDEPGSQVVESPSRPVVDHTDPNDFLAGILYVVIMVLAIALIIMAISESLRFKTYRTRYYGVATPPPYRPVFFWHRPGSSWYRRHWRPVPPPPPPRPPRYTSGPRPGGGSYGGGYTHTSGSSFSNPTPRKDTTFGGAGAGKKQPRGGGTFGGMKTGTGRTGGFGGSFSGSSSRGSSSGFRSGGRSSGGSRGGSFGGRRK